MGRSTPCVNRITAESLVNVCARILGFSHCSECLRRGWPAGRSPGRAGPHAAASALRPWVRARLAFPSLCSGLPLEAESWSYTTILALSFCCSLWTGVEVHGCQVRWSRHRRDCGKKPHFAVMKPLNWREAWATGVTWSLCVSITKEKWSLRFFQLCCCCC